MTESYLLAGNPLVPHTARNPPAAIQGKKPKRTPSAHSGGKNSVAKKSTASATARKPRLTPARDLGDRFINRAALSQEPADKA
ncbi:hypothetical protein [Streptomyces sp. NRRL S-481]|uniref:hypothetical protein n=1 Tax=Streptomyces sp. NRRL S-481 TaxID=1463911 RepID=UPI00131AFDA2|nr:hypothetical protein [Streptomyces sp. NRRL S-481]